MIEFIMQHDSTMIKNLDRNELVRAVRMFVHYDRSMAKCVPEELSMRKRRRDFYRDILVDNLVKDDVVFEGCGGRDADYTFVTTVLEAW